MSKPQDPAAAETARTKDSPATACYALPALWEEIETGKAWARSTKQIDGNLMGLKCELKLLGTKYRWMMLNPQKFGAADTLQESIEQVETFLHNVQGEARASQNSNPQ